MSRDEGGDTQTRSWPPQVVNGLMDRPDWAAALRMPLGILPCGSGNALAAAINFHAGYGDTEGTRGRGGARGDGDAGGDVGTRRGRGDAGVRGRPRATSSCPMRVRGVFLRVARPRAVPCSRTVSPACDASPCCILARHACPCRVPGCADPRAVSSCHIPRVRHVPAPRPRASHPCTVSPRGTRLCAVSPRGTRLCATSPCVACLWHVSARAASLRPRV